MNSKILRIPAFFPDATYAAIHSLPFHEISEKLNGIVVTTLHMNNIGMIDLLKSYEEASEKMDFRKLAGLREDQIILSDSGGFQILSLINRNKLGKITEEGAKFRNGVKSGKSFLLTPEISQQIQHTIGSDIRTTLDVPFGDEDRKLIIRELERTTRWAQRSKSEYEKLTGHKVSTNDVKVTKNSIEFNRPLLNAVVQGGNYVDLRKESGNQLSSIGFDIYGYGGWAFDAKGKLRMDITEAFIDSVPRGSITYGMGIGNPDNIADCHKLGMTIFDCVLPTRNARHGSLFVHKSCGEKAGENYDLVRIGSQKYTHDLGPIDKNCDCPTCRNYSRSYIQFLLKKKNPVGYSLATLHNVWWYLDFMERINLK